MVSGIGIDVVEVARIERKLHQDKGFIEFVFSENEIAYCESKAKKAEHYAARFAAKEAFLKALGTGWKNDIAFKEVEVMHDENGRPEIKVSGDTAKNLDYLREQKVWLSISHAASVATAVVIIEVVL